MIGSNLASGELRIVKLDWSNFDEVEVHVQVEQVLSVKLVEGVEAQHDKPDTSNGLIEGKMEVLPVDQVNEEAVDEEASSPLEPPGVRYAIYDRRTIQPMGEYIPEGDRSRIDRLTLYKMFPEYDYKTFEIDSIRWEADEVRIFVRGERKKSPKARDRSLRKDLKHGKR